MTLGAGFEKYSLWGDSAYQGQSEVIREHAPKAVPMERKSKRIHKPYVTYVERRAQTANQLDYVSTRTWVGNRIYLLSALPRPHPRP